MAYGGKIQYDIGFNVDKSGLKDLQTQLNALAKTTPTELMKLNPGVFKDARTDAQKALYGIKQDLKAVQTAFNDAFNPTTGLMNLQKLNVALNQIGADKLSKSFSLLGQKGQDAFYQMTKSALTTNMQLKQTNTFLNKMGTTLINTLKWTFSSSLINRFVGAVRQAVGYVEHLDSSLNDIRIVTKKSADEMEVFGQRANDAAKALGKATTDYTEAALIYYQQGLSDEEVKARAETTLKAANVTGQATKTVSEQLTSVWNGFKVNAEQTEEYVDKLAAVAAISASNLEELSTGMSKVASAASNLGVDIDQLTAQISTIVSVTRQAPESVGTALKTIYARISDLKLGDSDEDGLGLGDVSGGLKKLGIEVLDAQGELRDLGTVIEEVAAKWDGWTSAQQAAIAQLMAGKRQYNNLVSLFSNWDMYEKAINTSRNATGELQKQQDIYMESTEAHLQQLKTEWEDFYDSILDSQTINSFTDAITGVVKLLTNFIDGIGGGRNALLLLSSTLTRVFSKQLSQGILNIISHFSRVKENAAQLQAQLDNIQLFKNTQQYTDNPAVKALVDAQKAVSQYYNVLSNEQINTANALAQQVGDTAQLKQEWEDSAQAVNNYMKAVQDQNQGKNIRVTTDNGASYQNYYKFDFKNSKSVDALKGVAQSLDKTETKVKTFTAQIGVLSRKFNQIDKDSSKFNKNINLIKLGAAKATESFKILNKQGIFKDIEPSKLNEIERSLNAIGKVKTPDDYANAIKNLEAAMEGVEPSAKQAIQALRQMVAAGNDLNWDAPTKQLNTFLKQANMQQFTNSIVNTIGAVGQFAGSINSLKHGFDVLGDSSLSAGEKITQFLSSAGMGIAILLSSGARLISGYKALNATMNMMNATKQAQIIANSKIYASNGMLTKQGLALIGIDYKKLTAEELLIAETDRYNKKLAEQAVLQKTLNPYLLAGTVAIIALTAAITTSISRYNEMRDSIKETAQATIEANNEKQEVINKQKQESEGLQDLIDQYKQGKISIQEFNDKKLDFIGTINDTTEAIINQANSWKEAQKQLDKYYADLASKEKENYISNRTQGLKQTLVDMDKNSGVGTSRLHEDSTYDYVSDTHLDIQDSNFMKSQYYQELEKLGIFYQTEDNHMAIALTITPDEEGFKKLEQIFEIQEKFGKEVKDSYTYQRINDIYQAYQKSEGSKIIKEAEAGIKEDEIKVAIASAGLNLQDTVEGLRKQKNVFIKELENSSLTEKEKIEAWKDYLLTSTSKAAKELAKEENNIANMINNWGYQSNIPEDKTLQDTEGYKRAVKLQQDLLNEGFTASQISLVSSEDWYNILFNHLSDEEIINQGKNAVEKAIEASLNAGFDDFQSKAGNMSDNLGTIISSAISGNIETGDDSAYAKMIDYLDLLKHYYPELTNEVETFFDTTLIGTEHWAQATYKIQEALDKIEFTNLNKKVEEAGKKIHNITHKLTSEGAENPHEQLEVEIVPETEDFIEAVDELLDADYAINVEVHSDAERDFTQLVDSMKQADDLASKIGEDFIVAADDIRELNNVFPGILQGIEYLGDGTIKLNEEIVQSAMNAATQQEALSTEELVTKLNNDKTYLQNKRNIYDTMVTILQDAANKGMVTEQTVTDFDAQMDELKALNSEIVAKAEIDNDKAVAENSAANAEISADNWTKSYEYASQAAFTFAQNAIRNAREVAKGPDGHAQAVSGFKSKSNFSFTWQGKNGASSEAKAAEGIKRVTKDTSVEQINSQIASLQNASEALGKEINDIDGMIAAAGAKLDESVKKNRDVGKKSDSSKGSKGSGGKAKDPEQLEYLEREEDIYRVVNQELEQIESQLNNIDKINSHQWGANYKKTLEQQNKLLKQQTSLLEKKNKLQIDDLATRRKQLEDEGLQFSNDGTIVLNAEEYLNELYLKHNALVAAYNEMSAADQEIAKADLETDENHIKAIEKKLEEYENLRKEADDIYSQLLEQHYAEIENEVEIFNAEVDVHLELKEAEKEWNDFWKEVIEDVKDNDFAGQIAADMKQLDTLIGVNSGFEGSTGEALLTHIQKELAEVDKTIASAGEDGLFGDNIKSAYDNLVKYRDQLMATLKEAKEKLDDISENYIKLLEHGWELIDKQVERFEAIGKHISHNIELIKLVEGEKAYDALDMQYENQYENNLQLLDTLKKSQDIAEQEMNKHKALMDQYAEGTPEREAAAKAYESSVNEYLKITEQLDSTLEDTLQSIQEQTENANAKILDTLDKAMSGGIGLDLVEEEWKLINDEANKYYDNVERYINMEEYTHQLNEAADAIGLSAENQQKLNEFREQELKQLNEKERLTSYDIEESRARLEILKQELALQDAQANKTKMRLRRDTQGNYNYQYVADESKVEEAENGLLTAKKEWYSIVKNRYQELSNDIIAIQKQQLEYAKQIKDAESAGDIERLNKYKELYNQNAEYLKWAMTEAEKNKRDMYNGTQLYFKQVDDTTLEQSKTTVRQLVDQWAGGGEQSFTGAVKKAIKELDAVQETFKTKTAEALNAAGVNYNNLAKNNIDPVLAKLTSLTDKNLFDKLANINTELEKQWNNLVQGAAAYKTFKEKAVYELGLVEKEIEALSQLITNMPSPKLETPSAGSAPDINYDKGSSGTNNTSGNNNTSSSGNRGTDTKKDGGDKGTQKTGYILTSTDIRGGNSHKQTFQTKDALKKAAYKEISYQDRLVLLYDAANDKQIKIPAEYSNQGKQKMIQMFRSGGYTGSWGNEGRLGILHQKELVLNENDTKNMLSAVQILRSIPYSVIAQSLINSSTNTASALSGINSGISGLAAAATNNESKTMVVNADFSGVHDADEIYQALLELENYGLQNSYSVAPHANSMY